MLKPIVMTYKISPRELKIMLAKEFKETVDSLTIAYIVGDDGDSDRSPPKFLNVNVHVTVRR